MKETLDTLAGMSMHEMGAHRASQLRKCVLKIREVQEHEEEIRDTHCLEVLERKRLAIFDELLREAGHRDTDLVQDIARGFDLSGPIPGCREFKPKLTLASMPVRELHRAAPLMREITMANTGSSGDAVQGDHEGGEQGVVGRTLGLGPTSVVSRRFGIWQGDKCRPIDDFKASAVLTPQPLLWTAWPSTLPTL